MIDANSFMKQLQYVLARGAGIERPMAGTIEATQGGAGGAGMWGTPSLF